MPNVFRNLPSVGEILESPPLKSLIDRVNRNLVVNKVKQFLDDMQSQVRAATAGMHVPAPAELALRIADWINSERGPAILPVINATGVILHPRLGRAPLADEALAELAALTRGYASFDMDLGTGSDSVASVALQRHLQRATGAEAATITSRLSGAVIVALAAMAANREVIVARGEVTVIDDSSLPDLFQLSGARLRETGTANVTRIDDYSAAITPQTAALLQVIANGFAVVGTAARPALDEMISLSRRSGWPLLQCLTQASLLELASYGINEVPNVTKSVQCGADLTIFPGDGFIGGPPCGILVGRRSLIDKIEAHPLMPSLRAEKLTLAALGATLRLYEDKDVAERAIPVLSLLATPLENLRQRAERIAPQIGSTGVATVEIVAGTSFVAGHEVPTQSLPTITLSLSPCEGTATQLATALRTGAPAVVGGLKNDRLVLDLRSVMPRDDLSLVSAFISLSRPAELQPRV